MLLTAAHAHWRMAADIAYLCSSCTQKFEHLFHVNEEHGSFYLQSKVRLCRSMCHPLLRHTGAHASVRVHDRRHHQADRRFASLPGTEDAWTVVRTLPQVYRAKERLDQDFREKGVDVDAAEEAARAAQEAAEAASEQPGRQQ